MFLTRKVILKLSPGSNSGLIHFTLKLRTTELKLNMVVLIPSAKIVKDTNLKIKSHTCLNLPVYINRGRYKSTFLGVLHALA
jgi:hypothetical protein